MTVVAGPPGSGKSIRLDIHDFGVESFNVDDRCAQLNGGSCHAIPPEVRKRAREECEGFVQRHIEACDSFATETTLGGNAAAEQARRAKAAGYFTTLVYVATSDVAINIERVRRRGLACGHAAPPDVIREIHRQSLGNLAASLLVFDRGEVYDNSAAAPRLVLRTAQGRVAKACPPVPEWVREALAGSPLASQIPARLSA